MINRLKSLKVKTKILINSLILLSIMIVIAVVGYTSFNASNKAMNEMRLVNDDVYSLANIKGNMNAARAALVTMITEKQRVKQEEQHTIIKEETEKINKRIANLEKNIQDAKFADLKKVWLEFRDVRDQKLIPLLYKGDIEGAKAMGTGEQAERFKKIYKLSNELIEEHDKEKLAIRERVDNLYKRSVATIGILSAIAVLLGLFASVLIANLVTKPIRIAGDATNKIADGDLSVEIDASLLSKDEVGQMLGSLSQMVKNLKRIAFQTIEASNQVSIAADQIADANQNFSQRITEQAASIEETSSTMEEMSASIRQTAENAREANKLAQNTKTLAESGSSVMGDTILAMDEINRSSSKIANISNVIEEIAFQTNLLALNAAVEAARAGEHGKGFAVVASEIRNLAQRASQSAKEITGLIEDSVEKTGRGVQLAQELSKKLEEVGTSVKKVADLMDEVAAAAAEQSSGINQVNTAMSQIDQTTQQNASLVEETSASAEELSAEAKELLNLISFFKVDEESAVVKGSGRSAFAEKRTIRHAELKKEAKAFPAAPAIVSASVRTTAVAKEEKANGGFEEF